MLNKKEIEVEHIWSNHFDQHTDEFDNESDFQTARNSIGDLLVLPKSFNASYGDTAYDIKVKQYFSQNILAQTLNQQKYTNNPGFLGYMNSSGLPFKPYNEFKRPAINERTNLYRAILEYEFSEYKGQIGLCRWRLFGLCTSSGLGNPLLETAWEYFNETDIVYTLAKRITPIMRILDLDMDYFMTKVAHDIPETSTERLDEECYAEAVWDKKKVIDFI